MAGAALAFGHGLGQNIASYKAFERLSTASRRKKPPGSRTGR